MNNFFRYYSRTYELLDKLFDVCKYGYNKERYESFFWEAKLFGDAKLRDGIVGLMLTIFIALLGINKEKIEKDTRYSEYENNIHMWDIRDDKSLDGIFDALLKDFDDKRQVTTGFDSWLSVTNDLTSSNSNKENLKMIRNGFLHSQFELQIKNCFKNSKLGTLSFTKIDNKNYFNCLILNANFYQFAYSYFGNNPNSLKTENYFYIVNKELAIENEQELRDFLTSLKIVKLDYDMNEYDGTNSLEANLIKATINAATDEALEFNDKVVSKILNNAKEKGITLTASEDFILSNDSVDFIIKYLNESYGEKFYDLDVFQRREILLGIIACEVENTSVISNWLLNFYCLVNSINSNNLDLNPFKGDEYINMACLPTLLILKGYLVLYRIQNPNFDDLDYNKIDIDISKSSLYCRNVNGSVPESNYFEDMLEKIANKYPEADGKYLINKMFCETIRNAFAHGNVYFDYAAYDENGAKSIIVAENIYRGKIMGVRIPLDLFDKFLRSEAFLPENCYTDLKGKQFSKGR